jgi:hypothetical protein
VLWRTIFLRRVMSLWQGRASFKMGDDFVDRQLTIFIIS